MPILKASHSDSEIVADATEIAQHSDPTTATERLEMSRARLRTAMSPTRRQVALSDGAGSPGWLTRIENLPGMRVIIDALKNWWLGHPLRPVVRLAHHTTDAFAMPVAQSHPIAMVSAGVVLGALVIAARPWRWFLKRALFAGLVPQIVSSLPIDSWLGRLRAVDARQARTRTRTRADTQSRTDGQYGELPSRPAR